MKDTGCGSQGMRAVPWRLSARNVTQTAAISGVRCVRGQDKTQFAQTPDDAGASETKISQEVENQGLSQLLQQAITEYLEALRAWARHNQQPQTLIDTEASKSDTGR